MRQARSTAAIGSTATVLLSGDNPAGTINFGQGVLIALIWIMIAASNISYARAQLTLLWRYCGAPATGCTVRA